MHWLKCWFLLTLLSIVQAISSSGNRVLIVIEEASEKEKFSQFWGDLEGAAQTRCPVPQVLTQCF